MSNEKDMTEEELKEVIIKFIDRWNKTEGKPTTKGLFTNDLTDKSYRGYILKISYGQGTKVENPYITFLKYKQKTSKGVYPYIKYIDKDKTICTFLGESYDKQADIDDQVLKEINEIKETESVESTDLKNLDLIIDALNKNIETFEDIMNRYDTRKNSNNHTGEKLTMNNPLNQILYGPPGTGKTYNTINKALEIIDGKDNVTEDREEAKAKFDEYVEQGQIDFVTFHQSYGYEEFVEGIKAIPVGKDGNENGKEMVYDIADGIFKRIVTNSKSIVKENKLDTFDLKKNKIFKMSLGGIYDPEIRQWCLDNDYISMGWGSDIDFSSISNELNWEKYRDAMKVFLKDKKIEEKELKYTIQSIYAFKKSMQINDLVFISNGNSKIASIGQIIGEYEYNDNSEIKYSQFRKVKWLIKDANIAVEKIYNKKLSQQTIYEFYKQGINEEFFQSLFTEDSVDSKKYILIIDEINRGNISKIFGELITLIEGTKRLGNAEALKITLPYSGEKFGVPNNLYIIGTMNTADRSIALMDTALRRRFHFEEMLPDSDLLNFEVEGINIKSMLDVINSRIEYLYDRDHMIGHAYFICLKDNPSFQELENIFRNKIIPLLQEYFYDDWEKIQMILGDHLNQKADDIDKFIINKNPKMDDLFRAIFDDMEDEQTTFMINKIFTEKAYKKIYE